MSIPAFLHTEDAAVLGQLLGTSGFDVRLTQRDAWESEIAILRHCLDGIDGHLYLEFDVPRLGSRIDAVVVSGAAVVPIEFKVGAPSYERADYNQAWDYALDLKNFHAASHTARIFPMLVATEAPPGDSQWGTAHPDGVHAPVRCNRDTVVPLLRAALAAASGPTVDSAGWGHAAYRPTPTIIEAARALYARHSVTAISRSDAGATNLSVTSRRVEDVIDEARREGRKAIIFVTGVPGAGKTLVGLNVATKRRDEVQATHAVFLSGNGPLVAVLREALVRDELSRRTAEGRRERKGVIAQRVKPFIQNVHHFRDDGVRDVTRPPLDHVVIFDEAQRAWNLEKTSDFMRRRKGQHGFSQSEPEFLIGYMDRHADWAVIVCLVGGGQEIHVGEAGIGAWLDAVGTHYQHWVTYVSPNLVDSEYAAVEAVRDLSTRAAVQQDSALHLSVSLRSFRSERVSSFVKALLDHDETSARVLLADIVHRYPMALTRDLTRAKHWIREHARGSERYGLVASSQAERLKPHAIDIRVQVDPVQWFLNDASDTRSSYYLEDAATEFQVQGLELDWICSTWDADLRWTDAGWGHFRFRGDGWVRVRKPDRQQYLVNAYRVLLTRARQGMIIFVPPGDPDDPTRLPEFYDGSYAYLASLGVPTL